MAHLSIILYSLLYQHVADSKYTVSTKYLALPIL